MTAPTITLKPRRENPILNGHPWLYSGAVDQVDGEPATGETTAVQTADGKVLAWGAYSPESKIRVRVWTTDEAETIDAGFFERRIQAAVDFREGEGLLTENQTACRLVFAESDLLPGVIVDRYSDWLVVQLLTAGAEAHRETIRDALISVTGLAQIYERSDVEVRALEGLPPAAGPLAGEAPEGPVEIIEGGLRYRVDLAQGQKTGFYLDQRENRQRVRELASGREVLNGFAYTGGFSAAALAGGAASVLSIESSHNAVDTGQKNLALNGFDTEHARWIEGDVFKELRTLRDRARSFDLIVLDPPKFAATRAQAQGAARGYKDINLLAFKLLRAGGLLVTFSCSGGVDSSLFQKTVAGAAEDAGVRAQILERLSQGRDHPTGLFIPESEYLKGLVIRRLDG